MDEKKYQERIKQLERQYDALLWQINHEGCAASHLGETTYECDVARPCGLCRLRAERDRYREKYLSL